MGSQSNLTESSHWLGSRIKNILTFTSSLTYGSAVLKVDFHTSFIWNKPNVIVFWCATPTQSASLKSSPLYVMRALEKDNLT